jgi:hypothetical protein
MTNASPYSSPSPINKRSKGNATTEILALSCSLMLVIAVSSPIRGKALPFQRHFSDESVNIIDEFLKNERFQLSSLFFSVFWGIFWQVI